MPRTHLPRTAPATSTGPLPLVTRAIGRRAAVRSALALPLLALPLAACGGAADDEPAPATDPGTDAGAETDAPADPDATAATNGPVTVTDPWVKAADEGMTSMFGTLTNSSGAALTLVGGTTEAASEVELHQTASDGSGGMSMEQKEGGFPIPADGELVLEPGGDHIMLMGLSAPLQPGDQVEVVLQFEDGTEHPVTATVKDFAGAQENYGGMEEDQ